MRFVAQPSHRRSSGNTVQRITLSECCSNSNSSSRRLHRPRKEKQKVNKYCEQRVATLGSGSIVSWPVEGHNRDHTAAREGGRRHIQYAGREYKSELNKIPFFLFYTFVAFLFAFHTYPCYTCWRESNPPKQRERVKSNG